MAWTPIGVGSSEGDGNGDKARLSFQKVNLIVSTMWDTIIGGIAYLLGNVGIGTNTPLYDLDVESPANPRIRVHGTTSTNTGVIIENTDGAWFLYVNTDGDYLITNTGGTVVPLSFSLAGNVEMKILPVYANNAAALVGGLVAGDLYKTAATGDASVNVTNAT